MGHGGANALGMGHGAGEGPGMAQGRANGLQGLATTVARALGMGHGAANTPGTAHGAGKGPARGGGFGFGHASVGNPGHNALSILSSHSQNISHKGETHDGRSFSSHSHSTQSLAQHHTVYSTKADEVVQVDDRGPGKQKGFDNSPALQADLGKALNPDTVHSDLDDIVTLGLQPSQARVQPGQGLVDGGGALNPETIHSDFDEIAIPAVQPSPEVQGGGGALNLEAIHSDLDETMTLRLQAGQELQTGRGKSLQASWQTIVPDIDDTPATAVLPKVEQYRPKGLLSKNPELDDDDDKWKCVPYFGAVLLFFSWISQNWTRRVTKGKELASS
jgi:hypothetical protein